VFAEFIPNSWARNMKQTMVHVEDDELWMTESVLVGW